MCVEVFVPWRDTRHTGARLVACIYDISSLMKAVHFHLHDQNLPQSWTTVQMCRVMSEKGTCTYRNSSSALRRSSTVLNCPHPALHLHFGRIRPKAHVIASA